MLWPWTIRPPCVLRTVICNRRDDPSIAIRGVLWATVGPWWTLRNAQLLRAASEPTPVDGEIVVHRDNIAFVQVLP